jgi:hypothetical protein
MIDEPGGSWVTNTYTMKVERAVTSEAPEAATACKMSQLTCKNGVTPWERCVYQPPPPVTPAGLHGELQALWGITGPY